MPLKDQRILLIEDNVLIAHDIEGSIHAYNGAVTARASTLEQAMERAETPGLTSAILDFRLGADDASPVAEKLSEYGVPFLFYTAYSKTRIAEAWPNAPIVVKPASPDDLISALASLIPPKIAN
jgi:DNA-binding response OmpR family regulator